MAGLMGLRRMIVIMVACLVGFLFCLVPGNVVWAGHVNQTVPTAGPSPTIMLPSETMIVEPTRPGETPIPTRREEPPDTATNTPAIVIPTSTVALSPTKQTIILTKIQKPTETKKVQLPLVTQTLASFADFPKEHTEIIQITLTPPAEPEKAASQEPPATWLLGVGGIMAGLTVAYSIKALRNKKK